MRLNIQRQRCNKYILGHLLTIFTLSSQILTPSVMTTTHHLSTFITPLLKKNPKLSKPKKQTPSCRRRAHWFHKTKTSSTSSRIRCTFSNTTRSVAFSPPLRKIHCGSLPRSRQKTRSIIRITERVSHQCRGLVATYRDSLATKLLPFRMIRQHWEEPAIHRIRARQRNQRWTWRTWTC